MSRLVSLAVAPDPIPGLAEALEAAGAELVEPASAEAIVWTSPGQPDRLAALLEERHRWVALVIAGIVAYLLVLRQHRKRTRALTVILAVLFAVTMGLSRVFLGHHWLTDVLVAWTLGIAWLAVVITAHRLFLTFRLHRAALRDAA